MPEKPVRALPSRRIGPAPTNSWGYSFDEWVGYHSAHNRVRSARGAAKFHACVACGGFAIHWAYNGKAKHEFSGAVKYTRAEYELSWSGNPADYDPMCGTCHKKQDVLLNHLRWLKGISPDLAEVVKRLIETQEKAPALGT